MSEHGMSHTVYTVLYCRVLSMRISWYEIAEVVSGVNNLEIIYEFLNCVK